jgi:hypothetical protein
LLLSNTLVIRHIYVVRNSPQPLMFLSKYCRVTFSITHIGVFQPV